MTGEPAGTSVLKAWVERDQGLSGVMDAILFIAILGFSAIALLALAVAAPLAIGISALLAAASALTARGGRRGGWRIVGAT
jgi:hypothetical protein